jgi:hypothetical protein
MFEMTEALIHHARFCILNMTHADSSEIEQTIKTAQTWAFDAGKAAFTTKTSRPNDLPVMLHAAYDDGFFEAQLADSEEREYAEWSREFEEELEEFRQNYPDSPKERFIFCPNGHNSLFTKSGYEECAECGCLMTEAAEESFCNTLTIAGQCM